jgi:RNA polymerase sigma-70 factor (ECF subfamily)
VQDETAVDVSAFGDGTSAAHSLAMSSVHAGTPAPDSLAVETSAHDGRATDTWVTGVLATGAVATGAVATSTLDPGRLDGNLDAGGPDASTVDTALSAAAGADRVLHSDPHDFAGLYIRHRWSFTLHARRYLRDGRDADEVVQEAFLRLFLALPELETELQALAYCRRTITNLCIDRYRAQARRPSLIDLDSVAPEDLADDDPGDPVVRAEDAAIVREAMAMLSPLHRAALVKREIEEKPLPVIAQELDVPEESVKHLLFRARRALRRLLATTSVAPGSDIELAGGLTRAAKVSSGGMAGFLLVLALSLGTGPDLRAIPVVGTDLPDLIPVTSPATDKAPTRRRGGHRRRQRSRQRGQRSRHAGDRRGQVRDHRSADARPVWRPGPC